MLEGAKHCPPTSLSPTGAYVKVPIYLLLWDARISTNLVSRRASSPQNLLQTLGAAGTFLAYSGRQFLFFFNSLEVGGLLKSISLLWYSWYKQCHSISMVWRLYKCQSHQCSKCSQMPLTWVWFLQGSPVVLEKPCQIHLCVPWGLSRLCALSAGNPILLYLVGSWSSSPCSVLPTLHFITLQSHFVCRGGKLSEGINPYRS